MNNIEHIISHFDGKKDWKKWLKVDENYTTAESARRELRQAISQQGVIGCLIEHYTDESIHVFLRFSACSGPGAIPMNIPIMRRAITRTELMLSPWIPGEGYECEIDPDCNVQSEAAK